MATGRYSDTNSTVSVIEHNFIFDMGLFLLYDILLSHPCLLVGNGTLYSVSVLDTSISERQILTSVSETTNGEDRRRTIRSSERIGSECERGICNEVSIDRSAPVLN